MLFSLKDLLFGPVVHEAAEEPNPLVRRSVKPEDTEHSSEPIDPSVVRVRREKIVSYNLQDYEHHFKLAEALAVSSRSSTNGGWLLKREGHRPQTQEELDSFRKDSGPVWLRLSRQSPAMLKLVLLCGLGAMVQGWDEAAINGAQVYFRGAYELPPNDIRIGIINGIPYACCVLSCVLSWPLNKYLGRRWTIFLAGLCSIAFALGQSFANDWKTMLVLRAFLGFGIGPKSVTIPIYASEVAPASLRGALVMSWQLFTALGIMFGYLSGVWFAGTGSGSTILNDPPSCTDGGDLLSLGCSINWRLMIGSPAIAPILLCLYIFVMPESPRWLIANAQRRERHNNRLLQIRAKDSSNTQIKDGKQLLRIDLETIYLSFVRLRGGNKLKAAKDMLVQDVLLWVQKEELELNSEHDATAAETEKIEFNHGEASSSQPQRKDVGIHIEEHDSETTETIESDIVSESAGWDPEGSGNDIAGENDNKVRPESRKKSILQKVWEEINVLFRRRRNRNAFFASFIVMLLQQYCGVNVLIYYSTQILFQSETGKPTVWSNGVPKFIALSSIVGAANFVFGLPAIFLIDRRGRRQLLLRTFPLLALFAGFVAIGSRDDLRDTAAREPLILIGMYAFVIFYSYGEGPVPFVYASESFPQDIRDLGMAVVTSLNWALNFVVAVSFPSMSSPNSLGVSGTFAFYSCCCAAGCVLIFLFVPETCQKELENLDEVFQKHMLTFAAENIRELVKSTKHNLDSIRGIFRSNRMKDEES